MNSKTFKSFAVLLFGLMLWIICHQLREEAEGEPSEAIPAGSLQSTELIAAMENEMALLENEGNMSSSTDNPPDYTKLFPDLYTEYEAPGEMDQDKKIAYLTFDDGPSYNTFKILDVLQEKGVKATFFVVGNEIDEAGEDCLIRMVNEGHTIGIHTYSHNCSQIYCSIERYLTDFNKVYQKIYDVTGERVHIYRFPLGSFNRYTRGIKDTLLEEMDRRGFACYDWNVSSDDTIGYPTPSSILHNIKKDLDGNNYPIILMHDSMFRDLTARMLPQVIDMLEEEGYEFDTLDHRKPYLFPWKWK